MQKLTHTSHLWKLGGLEPLKDIWLIPVLKDGTEHVIVVQRLGRKNQVSVCLVGGLAGSMPTIISEEPAVKARDMEYTVKNIIQSLEFSRALWVRSWKVTHEGGLVTQHPYLWEALFVHLHSNPEITELSTLLSRVSG